VDLAKCCKHSTDDVTCWSSFSDQLCQQRDYACWTWGIITLCVSCDLFISISFAKCHITPGQFLTLLGPYIAYKQPADTGRVPLSFCRSVCGCWQRTCIVEKRLTRSRYGLGWWVEWDQWIVHVVAYGKYGWTIVRGSLCVSLPPGVATPPFPKLFRTILLWGSLHKQRS